MNGYSIEHSASAFRMLGMVLAGSNLVSSCGQPTM
jgi:hypothetical protein